MNMGAGLELLLSGVIGYLLGAVPTGVIICRLLRGVDLRQTGSGHTGGTNVLRIAGFWAGAATALIDVLLGSAAVALAAHLFENPWAPTTAGVLAVIGHNWSIFIHFGGGIGLSSLAGALLWTWPLDTLISIALLILFWLILVRLLHIHRARATVATMVVTAPLLWAVGLPNHGILLGVLAGGIVILKTLPDWNRLYATE